MMAVKQQQRRLMSNVENFQTKKIHSFVRIKNYYHYLAWDGHFLNFFYLLLKFFDLLFVRKIIIIYKVAGAIIKIYKKILFDLLNVHSLKLFV